MPGQALPLLVVSALLLCANPTHSSTEEGGDLAEAVRVSAEAASREPTTLSGIAMSELAVSELGTRPVVASSPLRRATTSAATTATAPAPAPAAAPSTRAPTS
jgi:hypothetical protein